MPSLPENSPCVWGSAPPSISAAITEGAGLNIAAR